ncbi:DUF4142 domain-containing protein [Acetobacter orleanensis]|nr:DUF4142 domain-containing protein [Acetobacter orleanensis]KXV63945.1 hypothetical protein AD949_06490 [Acetobacter orleanensis]PCD79719.1 DUF4142 domain-containing protein [Acetobacter orleanensis]
MLRLSRHQVCACSSLLVSLFALTACMNPGQPSAPPLPALATPFVAADTNLAAAINDADLTQIALATLAQTHAARSDIAQLGTVIVKNLTDNRTSLVALATTSKATMAEKPFTHSQKVIDQMQHLHGATFDKNYVRYLASSTKTTIAHLDAESVASKNTDLLKISGDLKTKLLGYTMQIQ